MNLNIGSGFPNFPYRILAVMGDAVLEIFY